MSKKLQTLSQIDPKTEIHALIIPTIIVFHTLIELSMQSDNYATQITQCDYTFIHGKLFDSYTRVNCSITVFCSIEICYVDQKNSFNIVDMKKFWKYLIE
jgi:hypothetical protein